MRRERSLLRLPPPLEDVASNSNYRTLNHLLLLYTAFFIAGMVFLSYLKSTRSRNIWGWSQSTNQLADTVQKDWVDVEEYHLNLLQKYAPAALIGTCKDLASMGMDAKAKDLDSFLFQKYFRRMRRQGVFLQITSSSTPLPVSFPTCFGWKGVVVSPQAPTRLVQNVRQVQACVGPQPDCKSLKTLLEENPHVLGQRDRRNLRYGSEINLVVIDLDGKEAQTLACSVLHDVFSEKPTVQVWLVKSSLLSEELKRIVNAALTFVNLVQIELPSHIESDYSVYILLNSAPSIKLSPWSCTGHRNTPCALAHMTGHEKAGFSISCF